MTPSLSSGAAQRTASAEAIAAIEVHFATSIATAGRFINANADAIADACRQMANRFRQGGLLIVFGEGAQASDAAHVSVEFVHPILVGKRALPAIALSRSDGTFVGPLSALGTSSDIALAICGAEPSNATLTALAAARERGMLTLLLSGALAPDAGLADITFPVADANPLIVQEVHETVYHVLWELVHVFLDDQSSDGFPFAIGPAGSKVDGERRLLAQVRESTRQKCRDICDLRRAVHATQATVIAGAASAIAERVARGGRLLAFGNGGSATDAQDAVLDCMRPLTPEWRRIPALALTNDIGVVTAVANDVGFDHVFSRQVLAFGRCDDVALGVSTSGTSRSVVKALADAKSRGLLTIALAGYDGGALARPGAADFCVVAESDYVPRIQEAHATIWHALLVAVQTELARTGTGGRP